MADSTPTENLTRQTLRGEALEKAIQSAGGCEIFRDALTEYMVSEVLVDSLHDDETILQPAANFISKAAMELVIAASDYHTAKVVYAVQEALLALDGEEA